MAAYNGLRSAHEVPAGFELRIPGADVLAGVDVPRAVAQRTAQGVAYYAQRQASQEVVAGVEQSSPPVGPDGLRIGPTAERVQLLAGVASGVSLIPGAAPGQVAPPVQRSSSLGDFLTGFSVAAGRTSVLEVPDAVYESEGYKSGYSLNKTVRRPLEFLEATGFISTDGSFAAGGVGGVALKRSGVRLLANEGKVGTYDDLIAAGSKGDNITPHHIPSANRMALESVSKGDGIAINMEQPFPGVGGRHRATFTYGSQADIGMSARDALAAGIWDARQIYRSDGLYTPQIRHSLQELIQMNKTTYPAIFGKPGS